ncbi:PAS domain S-box protein [Desertivirga arenae]|uniref:PAS domain S-box protein n=1 Tax=Desertivirga arenae TaxID=2810309 RepID=UPI0035106C89
MNFDNLFYQSPQPMLIFDIDTYLILEVNAAAIAHYGYSREEFLSLSTRDLRVSEERVLFDNLKSRFKASDNVFAEGQHLLRSGKVINVQIVSYIVEFKQKKCRLAHIHDVSSVVRQARNFEILVSIGALSPRILIFNLLFRK